MDDGWNEIQKVIGNKGLNFGYSRYDYSNGYFPTLKTNYSANLYWGSGNLNIVQNKIPIPNRTVEFTEDAVSLEDAMLLEDMEVSVMSLDILQDEELPDISVYASDIDKINIEFRNLK